MNSAANSAPAARGRLLSIQVGRVTEHAAASATPLDGRPPQWRSAIVKSTVQGPVAVSAGGIDADEQADLKNHGGPDNVVLAYDADHYPLWRTRLNMPALTYGNFGENFTVAGFSDDTVCIGDVWHVGPDLILQVTQARQPCYKLARRLKQPEIVKLVRENSWGGWYLRVLQPGAAEAGMDIALAERPHPQWTVARAVQTMYARKVQPARAAELSALPELSARWKCELRQ
jgi:MOSC domain-containing protein YiiM